MFQYSVYKINIRCRLVDNVLINIFIINADLVFRVSAISDFSFFLTREFKLAVVTFFDSFQTVFYFPAYFSGPWRVPGEVGQNRLQESQISSEGPSISKSAKLYNVCSNI